MLAAVDAAIACVEGPPHLVGWDQALCLFVACLLVLGCYPSALPVGAPLDVSRIFRQLLMSRCHCGSCALFCLLGSVESLQAQGLLNQDAVHVLLTELLHAVWNSVVLIL